jgi:GNAT acetyltransferase-like protein
MSTIIARDRLGKDLWDAAADASPEAWLYHRYDLCDASVRDWHGRSDAGFAVVSGHDEVEAIVPAFIMQRRAVLGLPVRYLNSMGGPALSSRLGRSRRRATLDAVGGELRRRANAARVIRTTISLPPVAPALRGPDGPRCNPLLHLGCNDISGATWITDLRDSLDTVWNRLDGRVRTNIRKAEAAGMTARGASSGEWPAFVELHQLTYRRIAVPTYPTALFRTIFEQLIPAQLCYVQFAELNGELIAAHNIACYKQGGYFWHGFASEAGLHANALTFLWWHSVRSLAEEGRLQWMDTGEAVLDAGEGKLSRLSDFKKGFGGELYPVFRGEIKGTDKLYNRLLHLKGLISGQ